MAEDWKDLLDMDATKAVRPPPLPKGTYRGFVAKQQNVRSTQKETPGLEFTFTKIEPTGDVDADKWAAYKQHPAIDGSDVERDDTFWLTKKAMPRLREFLEKCGAKAEGATISKMVTDAMNQTVLLSIDQRVITAKNGDSIVIDEITGYAVDMRG